jgi:RNA polymerase sigma-70 factor, ECF subfamily
VTPIPEPLADRQTRFDALVLPHLDRLLAFAVRRTDVRADAEDAVQEACVRAWLGFDELRDPARVRAWIYRILRTVLSEAGEKGARRRQLVSITRLEDAHEQLVAGEADAVFEEVAARLSGEEVRAALAQLPDDFATAVELHDIDGFKYHEIAEIVGVPIGTVMSRLSRGRRLLAGAVLAARGQHAAATQAGAPTSKRGPRGGTR